MNKTASFSGPNLPGPRFGKQDIHVAHSDPRTVQAHTALEAASTVLFSPHAYRGIDEWRRAVTQTLSSFLGADRAIFILSGPGIERSFSPDYSAAELDTYVQYHHANDPPRLWAEQMGLEVWNWQLSRAGGAASPATRASNRQFLFAHGARDAMGVSIVVPGFPAHAELIFHSVDAESARFGDSGLAAIRQLLPAFKVGAAAAVRQLHQRASLLRHLESMSEGARVYDSHAKLVHENRIFSLMLNQEPVASVLEGTSASLAQELIDAHIDSDGHAGPESSSPVVKAVDGEMGRYELRGSVLGRALFSDDHAIWISLHRLQQQTSISEAELKSRYKLTTRELDIALLLAQGQSNKKIAHSRAISLHTVRRHTEKIFAKLGANARAQIAAILRGHTEPLHKPGK